MPGAEQMLSSLLVLGDAPPVVPRAPRWDDERGWSVGLRWLRFKL